MWEVCSASFKTMRSLVSHKTLMHDICDENSKIKTKYQCDVCGYNRFSYRKVKFHLFTHSEASKVFCKVCQKGFFEIPSVKKTSTYTTRRESNKSYFRYGIIGQSSKSRYIYDRTENIVSTNRGRSSFKIKERKEVNDCQCLICGKRARSLYHTKIHLLTHLKGKGRYVCKICDKSYRMKSEIEKHVLEAHNVTLPTTGNNTLESEPMENMCQYVHDRIEDIVSNFMTMKTLRL